MALPKPQTHSQRLLKIGEVAARSGLGVEALRFYESRGLLQPASRTESGYRMYDDTVFERLDFIRKSQTVGFNLDEIARIISDTRDGSLPCAEVRRLAAQKLAELDRRLAELKRYRRELKVTVDAWDQVGEKKGVICGLIEGLQPAADVSRNLQLSLKPNAKPSNPRRRT